MTQFEKDLFISYSHIDNEPLSPEQKGWVTRFHKSLEALLNMRMGGRSRIWRDDKLTGNDVFSDEIVDQFSNTALMVSVLSPRYLKSEWCTKEIREFCEKARQSGGIVVDNKARIYKVLKTPVETQDCLPEVVQNILGYEFFTMEDGTPLELDAAYGEKFAQDYNRKVGKLAWDISQFLKRLEEEVDGASEDEEPDKPIVYLAECSYDRRQEREILEGELKHLGYTVLPEKELPRDENEYIEEVDDLLKRCSLSVHLVGNTFGSVPDGPNQKSVAVLQNELGAKHSQSDGLVRVIWLPAGTRSEQPQQQAFLESLHKDAEAQRGADLITGDLEALKSSVHAALKKLEKPVPETAVRGEQSETEESIPLIYLICDEKDRGATIPLRKFCKSQGFDVEIPVFQGDATEIREAHQQLLKSCDAIILFYGAGDEAWKFSIDSDIRKMPAYREGKSLPHRFTYLADPTTTEKEEMMVMEEAGLIDGLGGFSESAMADFISAMKKSGGSS